MRLSAFALLVSLAASAEDTSVRAAVHLKDGSVVSGTVRRMKLGKSITLTLPDAKVKSFEDADVVKIELFGGATPEAFDEQSVKATAPAAKPGAERAPPLPQAAPVSDLDTVYLNDGNYVRGTIESEKPDVVVKLLSGRKRTIAARDVKSIVRHGAPQAAEDTVYLKDGSVLRGTVESEKPDVVVKLLSGKKRTLPAAQVQRIEKAKR